MISAAGHHIVCKLLAPTMSAPKIKAAGMAPMGLSLPNKATTIPLKPAEPVKPASDPSVNMR